METSGLPPKTALTAFLRNYTNLSIFYMIRRYPAAYRIILLMPYLKTRTVHYGSGLKAA